MDLICYCWRSPMRGVVSYHLPMWATLLRVNEEMVKLVFEELSQCNICDIVTTCHNSVTVSCRRMLREEKARSGARLRKQKQRVTQPSHASVTGEKLEVRSQKSEIRGQNKEELRTPIVPYEGTTGFDEFWNIYPRKVGKGAAWKAWQKAKGKPPVVELVQVIEQQKQSEQWQKENGRFIPNPATWLNQGRWADQLPTKPLSLMEEFLQRGKTHDGPRAVLPRVVDVDRATVGAAVPRSRHTHE